MLGNLITESKKANSGRMVYHAILGVIGLIVGSLLLMTSENIDPRQNFVAFAIPIGLMFGGICFLVVARTISYSNKSYVHVYSEGVKGMYNSGHFVNSLFEVKHDQIMNIDADKIFLTLHTSYGNYKCTIGNAFEIREVIMRQKDQAT